jgi:hypothetical protein
VKAITWESKSQDDIIKDFNTEIDKLIKFINETGPVYSPPWSRVIISGKEEFERLDATRKTLASVYIQPPETIFFLGYTEKEDVWILSMGYKILFINKQIYGEIYGNC